MIISRNRVGGSLGWLFQEVLGTACREGHWGPPPCFPYSRGHPLYNFSLPSSHSHPFQVLQQAGILPQDISMISRYVSDVRMSGYFNTAIFSAFYKLYISLVFIDWASKWVNGWRNAQSPQADCHYLRMRAALPWGEAPIHYDCSAKDNNNGGTLALGTRCWWCSNTIDVQVFLNLQVTRRVACDLLRW